MGQKKLAVIYRPVDSLKPYAKNARTHSEAQVGQIAASITEFGFTQPILVDGKSGVVAGHGRLLAAKSLGMAEVPVIELSGLSAAQKRAYVIADNKLTLNGGWDDSLLAEELKALGEAGFDLKLTGFDDVELVSFLSSGEGKAAPDDVPEAPPVPVTRLGDVWLCGDHRVMCGDSTVAEDVQTSLGGAKPHLMVTDPPYGVEYDPAWREKTTRFGPSSTGLVANDGRADWREAWALFAGDVAYVWCASIHNDVVIGSLESVGFIRRSQIIWAKQHFTFGRGDYHWQHEPCWYAVRKGGKGHWAGDRKQTSVWEIANNNPMGGKTEDTVSGHGTQKPVECMKRPIENNSQPGDAVYDPFLGSGTTMIAAEMTGRRCYGIELSPAYVDVIVNRWQAFTGREATLMGTSTTFAEIARQRAQKAA